MDNQFIIENLSPMISEKRLQTFSKVLNNRTRYITVVLENLFQSHNASAVMRSCDCFGIQNIHIIENNFDFIDNPDVSLGSSQWLTKFKYNSNENNSIEAIKNLKNQGYRIVATTPHSKDVNLNDFNLEKGKIALFFGAELPGLSKTVLDNADEFVKIPMFGFTESFNISVSVAICLYDIINRLKTSNIKWELSEPEKQDLLAEWLKLSVRNSEKVLKLLKERNI
ncbi:MAG: RNA methyltransferase [Bacteroidales bacterium]|jgi:tRNA (guanosine-2'-O-)-methyltransferase|nr:RNA methyltransferase [Bacteroidales bacterium]MCK9499761.1 RNA methyltransferase [Bacteroidales bacterium]MDY0315148.1 RNA methyltransferase [Bacteroidales bacterium]NLB87402.1 RNA methyltransferase [Bacteroidales bacterium]